jgi:hypothetical protein
MRASATIPNKGRNQRPIIVKKAVYPTEESVWSMGSKTRHCMIGHI